MRGNYARKERPTEAAGGTIRIACVDIGGQDEAATDPVALLSNPGRDYSVATIFEFEADGAEKKGMEGKLGLPALPIYRAVDVFVDHGSRHFQDVAGRPSLVKRMLAWLKLWRIDHLIVDSAGVGEGIFDYLRAALGGDKVTGYDFQGRGKKAALGSSLLSLVETGRFQYWAHESEGSERDNSNEAPLSDGWWFWLQVARCTYELPPGGRFERDLRWGVPAGTTVGTPSGRLPLHDDRLLSAALIALADDLLRSGKIRSGQAKSAMIEPYDPLDDLQF